MFASYVATMDIPSVSTIGRRVAGGALCWLALATPALAQPAGTPASGPVLTLPDALALAARHSPLYERVEARFGIARGEVRTAGQWPNPTLEYRRENLGAPIDPDEFFTAYIPIDVTGRRVQLARATGRATSRLVAERTVGRQDAALSIARAWVAAVQSAELARLAAAQHEAAMEVARLEAVRADEGVSSEAAARRTRVESTRLGLARALAEARAVQERAALATQLGVPADSLPALPAVAGPTSNPLAEVALEAPARALLDELAALDEPTLLLRAQRDRAELRAVAFAREEAALRRSVERGGVLGDWQLQGGSKLTGGFFTGQVGLAVPLPLFNRNAGARERTAGLVRDAEAAERATTLAVTGEVHTALVTLRRLEALGATMTSGTEDAAVIADAARVAYTEGHISLLELLDALRASADARATATQYAADLLLARLTLARAVGAPVLVGDTP